MIMPSKICVFILLSIIAISHSVPKPDSNKRVVDKPLSNEEHYGQNDVHNAEYDHEAFLGEEEAKKFEQLSPEESKARLGKIVDKIDKDKDGIVSENELKEWIKYTQKKYISDDIDRQWLAINPEQKDLLDWDSYKKQTYSFIDEERYDDDEDDIQTYKNMMKRDKRRWELADKSKDGLLSKEEFADFLHPEESVHMQDIVIVETIEDIDQDGDGKISLQEYIVDMYSGNEEDEPDWVKTEKEQFAAYRDKDNDSFMDKDEVKDWILPGDFDHSEAEAKHLIYEADDNKDKKLSKEEILNNYDVFVGSQATDYGEALNRHDEF